MRASSSFLLGFAVLLSSLLLGGASARGADLAAAHQSARAGNEAYERGDFEAATTSYRAALQAGLDHPIVHFNLGNALYKQGELGAAIASFARAQRQAPRNASVRANLERARSQIRDKDLSSHALPAVLRPLGWFYGVLSLNEWAFLLLVLVGLLTLAGVGRHWALIPAAPARRTLTALGVALALVAVITGLHYRSEVLRQEVVVVVEEIEVRSGPGNDYNLAFRIHEGLQVQVAESRGEWLRVDLGGELVGWVPARQVELL